MVNAKKANGTKTMTIKQDGNLYQVRMLTCGKDSCKKCAAGEGHPAVYMDTGQKGGARWQYVGKELPAHDPDYTPPTCQREGCENVLSRRNQKFCSARCKMAHRRAQQ